MSIKIENITKRFANYRALRGINLEVEKGELVALLGPSGCGKTTLLRIIAGLEIPDAGGIYLFNESMNDKTVRERNVGFVFQHYALFKHMTVFENIAFGLKVKPRKIRPRRDEIEDKVSSVINLVQLEWAAKRYPSQLSGGERQRVALARSLAIEPKVLLLDEPFGALDAKVRRELRRWLRHLHHELNITSIFVTHDQEEALEVADRVVVMNKGKIEQVGTPMEVYEKPANAFVYNFIGNVNQFSSEDAFICNSSVIDDSSGVEFVRPHNIKIVKEGFNSEFVPAVVTHIFKFGASVRIELKHIGSKKFIDAAISNEEYDNLVIKVGDEVYFNIEESRVF